MAAAQLHILYTLLGSISAWPQGLIALFYLRSAKMWAGGLEAKSKIDTAERTPGLSFTGTPTESQPQRRNLCVYRGVDIRGKSVQKVAAVRA